MQSLSLPSATISSVLLMSNPCLSSPPAPFIKTISSEPSPLRFPTSSTPLFLNSTNLLTVSKSSSLSANLVMSFPLSSWALAAVETVAAFRCAEGGAVGVYFRSPGGVGGGRGMISSRGGSGIKFNTAGGGGGRGGRGTEGQEIVLLDDCTALDASCVHMPNPDPTSTSTSISISSPMSTAEA